MPIEFRCTQCSKLLRTPDDTAGKEAKCPECGTILAIPTTPTPPPPPSDPGPSAEAGQANPFAPGASPPGGAAAEENPYQSPGEYHYEARAPIYASPSGQITAVRIGLGDVLSRTWTIFKERLGICLAVVLVGMLVYMVGYGCFLGLMLSLGVFDVNGNGLQSVAAVLIYIGAMIAFMVFVMWLTMGVIVALLKIARGQEASAGDVFRGGPHLLRAIGAYFLFFFISFGVCFGVILAVSIAMGLLMFLIGRNAGPQLFFVGIGLGYLVALVLMIIISLMISMYPFLIVDRKAGVIESLSLSRNITKGNKLTMFALMLLVSLGGGLFVVVTCGLGLLFFYPFLGLLVTVMYLAMTGQPTADRLQAWSGQPIVGGNYGSPFAPPPGEQPLSGP